MQLVNSCPLEKLNQSENTEQESGTQYDLGLTLLEQLTAVSFWGQSGINYLEFECLVPKTGLEF